ncbi:MAG: ParA family protein [Pseudomonas marincola]
MTDTQTNNPVIFCVTSGKGGVGKTLIANSIAASVAEGTANVLMVDLDFENQGLTSLLSAHFEIPPSVQKWFPVDGVTEPDFKMLKLQENLYFLPAVATSSSKDTYRAPEIAALLEKTLKNLKDKVSHRIDLIILDCHGASDLFTRIAVKASNKVILVSEPDPVTFGGTVAWLSEIQELEPSIKLSQKLVLVVNRMTPKISVGQLEDILHDRLNTFQIMEKPEANKFLCIPTESTISNFFGKVPFLYHIVLGSVFRSKVDLLVFSCLKDINAENLIPVKIAKKFSRIWKQNLVYRRKNTLETTVNRHLIGSSIAFMMFFGLLLLSMIYQELVYGSAALYPWFSDFPNIFRTENSSIRFVGMAILTLFYGYLAFIWDCVCILYFHKTRNDVALVKRVKGAMRVWGEISAVKNAITSFLVLPFATLLSLSVPLFLFATLFPSLM